MQNHNSYQCPDSIEELVDEMEKHPDRYQYLKVFLRRDGMCDLPDFGEEYLAVSCEGFGLYRIESVNYQNERIIISLTDTSTNEPVIHSVDIKNSHPSCLFVRWKDVKNLVFNECIRTN